MAKRGYYVVSIQHELQGDPALPRTGDLFKRRTPLWERGVANLLCVLQSLKNSPAQADFDQVILIGHSNGGDISMKFADRHPDRVRKIISLDSLRHPFPTKHSTPILYLGAADTAPDPGVLPSSGVTVVPIHARHSTYAIRVPMRCNRR